MEQNVLVQWINQRQLSIPTLLLTHYKEIGLKENELVALLHVQSFIEQGDGFPTPEELSKRMTLSMGECANLLGHLVRGQYLTLEKKNDEQGIVYEFYTLDPLWMKIIHILKGTELQEEEQSKHMQEGHLFKRFEEEFSRPLSPIEAETLSMWLDQDGHKPPLILAALREAVVSSKMNFRYIDRILFEWKRNGVQSLDEAKVHGEKFRKYNQPKRQEQKRAPQESYPGFNWLEQS